MRDRRNAKPCHERGAHRGSNSIDGSAHAAVSATYAVANALAGRALEATSYAAYASVYSYSGYAVTEPAAFEDEFAWQVDKFKELRGRLQAAFPAPDFRPMLASDLAMLHDWLGRPHVAQWWGARPSYAEVATDYLLMIAAESTTRGYIAMLRHEPVGFFQSYVVMGSGGGWWENERDPGARGIDQFLANAQQLGRGLGSALVRAFTDRLLADPAVTQVQTDPSPDNERAIRCYTRAGFVARGQAVTPDGPALVMLKTRGPIPPSP